MLPAVLIVVVLVLIAYVWGAVRIIKEPYAALVERLGRYNRTLKPGVSFVVPFLDTIVIEALMSERVFDIPPQQAITNDNVPLTADAVVYWQILDLRRAYYQIDNIEVALKTLTSTILRSEIGQMNLDQTFSSRKEINQALLRQLDESTESWGAKVTRVEVQEITPAPAVLESMELERAAEIKKQAVILEAEGNVESIELLARALNMNPNSPDFLKFVIAQKYVEANSKLGESDNSKLIFMDPKDMSFSISNLLGSMLEKDYGALRNSEVYETLLKTRLPKEGLEDEEEEGKTHG